MKRISLALTAVLVGLTGAFLMVSAETSACCGPDDPGINPSCCQAYCGYRGDSAPGFSVGTPAGGDLSAVPGQTITRGQRVNPAIEAFLVDQNIVTTNALEEECAGQVISTGHLSAERACWLATGLANAYR